MPEERMQASQIEEAKARYMGKLVRNNGQHIGIVDRIITFGEYAGHPNRHRPGDDELVIRWVRHQQGPLEDYLTPARFEVWSEDA